ncbi:MAG: NAD-dependent epimerase/dehydratase family protein [bacterium]|nr:NAD-dependent epimerase/dehydratase family protein [bacterium]
MKCIVTGATGHVGNVLVKELYESGHQVSALCLPNDPTFMIDAYAEVIRGNILDIEFLRSYLRDVDCVFHLAGIVEIGSGKKKLMYQVNVQGTKNIVDVCLENFIPRLVYTSSVHAIKELPIPQIMSEVETFHPDLVKGTYAKTKAEATAYVLSKKDTSLDVVVVHPSGIIGPNDYQLSNVSQLFIDCLIGRLSAYMSGGYNFVDVRDVAKGIVNAAVYGKRGKCYILSGHEITVKELLDLITSLSHRNPIKTKIAYWFIYAMSYLAEAYYFIVKQKPLFTHYSIVVLHSNYHFSNQLAIDELQFYARDLSITISDTLEFVKENYLQVHRIKYKRKAKVKKP